MEAIRKAGCESEFRLCIRVSIPLKWDLLEFPWPELANLVAVATAKASKAQRRWSSRAPVNFVREICACSHGSRPTSGSQAHKLIPKSKKGLLALDSGS